MPEKTCERYGKHFRVIRPSSLLADYLRSALKEKRISYRELARRSGEGVSASTVGDILKGKNANPTVEIIQALAKGLDEPAGKVFAAACGVAEPKEPEGFKESEFWKLFDGYSRIDRPLDKKTADTYVESLIGIIDVFPKRKVA